MHKKNRSVSDSKSNNKKDVAYGSNSNVSSRRRKSNLEGDKYVAPVVHRSRSVSPTSESDNDWSSSDKGAKKKQKNKKQLNQKRIAEPISDISSSELEEGEITDSESTDTDEDEDEFSDGYDENLMGDEEDRTRLMKMTEREREQELFKRGEKREILRRRFEIERKLRLTKKIEDERLQKQKKYVSSRSKERRHTVEEKKGKVDKKAQAIEDLKKQREKKRKSVEVQKLNDEPEQKTESQGSDSESKCPKKLKVSDIYSDDEDASPNGRDDCSEASYHTRSEDEEEEPKRVEYITSKEDLNRVRLSRYRMEQWVHAPFFKETAIGCFVRIAVNDGKHEYRIAEIMDVLEATKIYRLGTTYTNKELKLRHGRHNIIFRLEFVSNSDFTDYEYFKWTKAISGIVALPTVDDINKKVQDIEIALNYTYKEEDVEKIVKEKEKFKKTPHNYAMKKTELLKNKETAIINGNLVEAKQLTVELEELEERAKALDKIRTKTISGISHINVRNRQRNIAEAEKAIREETLRNKNRATDDPFTRRKCTPILVTKSRDFSGNSSESQDHLEKKQFDIESNKKVNEQNCQKKDTDVKESNSTQISELTLREDLFTAHDFEIQIDLQMLPPSSSVNSLSNHVAKPQNTSKRSLNLEEYKKMRGLI